MLFMMSARENQNPTEAVDLWNESNVDFDQTELNNLLDDGPVQDNTSLRSNEHHQGFDNNAGDSWIYPSNLPTRSYQLSISQTALYNNTLVVLPTGLGKTFIAAVVMYNFYRFYPRGKVIFMAPTRPLVAQQIEACQRIMPFPANDTVELTGKLAREKRLKLWREKRTFFVTPQVMQSDISSHMTENTYFPFDDIKLLVFDEAHKAKGRYAYTEVAQSILRKNRYFRVLALSATPGRTMEDVVEVVRNLLISRLEVRWDSSVDVMPYIHQRSIKTIVVSTSDEIKRIREELIEIIDPYMRQLIDAGVLSGFHQSISKNFLLFEQKRFRERSAHQRHPDQAGVTSNFSICISLFHSLELLERHGLRVFLTCFDEDEDGRPKFVLAMNSQLQHLVETLRAHIGPNPFDVSTHVMTNGETPAMPENLDFGHPKFEEARKCLLDHFKKNPDSRAIVFCEYRESVMLIYRVLLQHGDVLKPRCFVGQGGTTGALRALTQKQQIQIMSDFRSGKSNILVATSIGEEGIDVGEVDLIVCFDISTANPTRFVQRIGRTGRQKQGHVVMLVTEGKEQQLLREVLAAKDQTNKRLLHSPIIKNALYQHCPRLVPTELNPKCVHMYIKPPEEKPLEKSEDKIPKESKVTKKTVKLAKHVKPKAKITKVIENTQDLRNFFKVTQSMEPLIMDNKKLLEARSAPTQDLEPISQNSAERSLNRIKDRFQSFNLDINDFDGTVNEKSSETRDITSCTSTEKSNKRYNIDLKRLKRLNKVLRSTTPLLTQAQRSASFLDKLKCPYFSVSGKKALIAAHGTYVRQISEQMSVLEAIEVDVSTSMCEEEQEIRATYRELMKLFKDRENLLLFLDSEEEKKISDDIANSNNNPYSDLKFKNAMKKIFEGLGPPDICCDNFEYRQDLLKKTRAYKNWLEQKNSESLPSQSMVYATLRQLDSSMQTQRLSHTPIRQRTEYSSAADTGFETAYSKLSDAMGPLQKAFHKIEAKKQENAQNMSATAADSDDDDDVCFVSMGPASPTELLSNSSKVKKGNNNSLTESYLSRRLENRTNTPRKLDNRESKSDNKTDPRPIPLNRSVGIGAKQEFKTKIVGNLATSTPRQILNNILEIEDVSTPNAKSAALPFTSTPNCLLQNEKSPYLPKVFDAIKSSSPKTFTSEQLSHDVGFGAPEALRYSSEYGTSDRESDFNLQEPDKGTKFKVATTATRASEQHTADYSKVLPLKSLKIPANQSPHEKNQNIDSPKNVHEKGFKTAASVIGLDLNDVNFDAFNEPFPEEEALLDQQMSSSASSLKENLDKNDVRKATKYLESYQRSSPDLFALMDSKTLNTSIDFNKPSKVNVRTGCVATTNIPRRQNLEPQRSVAKALQGKPEVSPLRSSVPQAVEVKKNLTKCKNQNSNPKALTSSAGSVNSIVQPGNESPKNRLSTATPANEKSPSVFDRYLLSTRSQLRSQQNLKTTESNLNPLESTRLARIQAESGKCLQSNQVVNDDTEEDSVIIRRPLKRKLIVSDSEEDKSTDCEIINASLSDDDSDFESIPATQNFVRKSYRRNVKRRRINQFIEQEAAVSCNEDESNDNDDNDEEDSENSLADFVQDRTDVLEVHPEAPTHTQMHAVYMKSLKSPPGRKQGAFKIPEPRIYNDSTHIYSQAPPVEPSHYVRDSFVVDEDDVSAIEEEVADATLSPLGRAERILKARRRAKRRQFPKIAIVNKARNCGKKRIVMNDSSSDDDDNNQERAS